MDSVHHRAGQWKRITGGCLLNLASIRAEAIVGRVLRGAYRGPGQAPDEAERVTGAFWGDAV
jgi:hypothetical protein